MTRVSSGGWLFTRGPQSVRLMREEKLEGCVRLVEYGPGPEVETYEFPELTECITRQAEIEQNLLAAGYQLEQPSADRRAEYGTWSGPDHRRAASG